MAFHKHYPLFASGSDDGTVIVCHGMVYKYVEGSHGGSASGLLSSGERRRGRALEGLLGGEGAVLPVPRGVQRLWGDSGGTPGRSEGGSQSPALTCFLHHSDLLQNPLLVPVKVLKGHVMTLDLGVLDVLFHPTQPWVFSSGADGTIRLYT